MTMKNAKSIKWVAVFLLLAGAYVVAGVGFRGWAEKSLTAISKRPVKVRSAYLVFPPALRLVGVEVPPVAGEARSPIWVDFLTLRPGKRPGERPFTLKGRLPDAQGGELAKVDAQGTYFQGGPVDAVVISEFPDISRLSSYLKEILGTAPAQGSMRMTTKLTLHSNVLMAHNDVTATGVAFTSAEPTTLGPDGPRLVELLRDKEGKIQLNFIVAGNPNEGLDWSDLTAGAMRESMRQAMSRGILKVMSDTEQTKPVEELMRRQLDTLDR